ncbi:MAG: type II toxin-antitoxin system VapC family toxin [Planctomycetes bacterium]|nr:type II toxin-antitoxin system VapC family toxin [Planctomycetota bacterium]
MLKMPLLASAVPTLWSVHLTELVLNWERAGRVTAQGAERCFDWIYHFQVFIDPETPARAWTDILDLARAHSVSVDDAAYLELSLRLNLPLATTDATLLGVAPAAGVPTFTP